MMSNISDRRIGRIVTAPERVARMNSETAATVDGEILRSAFAINDRFILTSWHCIREEYSTGAKLWFRLRRETGDGKSYIYLPVRVTNYDGSFDVAALTIDLERLARLGWVRTRPRSCSPISLSRWAPMCAMAIRCR